MIAWSEIKGQIPHKSGVYLFKNSKGEVRYVGKAIDLYHRVASYFTETTKGVYVTHPQGVLASHLRNEMARVETIVVESELEALILEANLIKKYLPPFNIRLTDDKDYLYIGITKEEFPRVITLRKKDLKRVKKFFGPFPSTRTVRDTLKLLRKIFPWCSSKGTYLKGVSFQGRSLKVRPCFYYHLGLCPGACVRLINKEDYNRVIKRFIRFIEGKKEQLLEELIKEMNKLARDERFEEASKIKKTIDGILYLTQPQRTKIYLENPNFLEDERKSALLALKQDLNLPNIPQRIEAYDISNIQGKEATGAMVVLTGGEVDKGGYRRFKIHISGRPNDVGMMREVIRRRLTHPEWPTPDLILVDGGRGQANAAKFEIPLFGLAKKREWLYPPEGEIVKLPRNSLSLKLLQKIRDEAHRFAIAYHRKLRDTIKRNENTAKVLSD